MKYETPELTALTPAINVIQSASGPGLKVPHFHYDGNPGTLNESASGYMDWEA